MTIGELKKIFERFDDDDDVLIEYMPRRHQYITEPVVDVLGVRAESGSHQIILLGVTETC